MTTAAHRTKNIVESCARLAAAMQPMFPDADVASQLAFHLADIKPELVEIEEILSSIEIGGAVSREQVSRIEELVCIHWPYHVRKIKAILAAQEIRARGRKRRSRSA